MSWSGNAVGRDGMVRVQVWFDAPTNLLHDAGFPLGESDVPTRLVANKLYLDLASLATALIIVVIVIVVGSALALSLDTATLGGSTAIAVRVVEVAGRLLVVLVRDVGHCFGFTALRVSRYHQDMSKSDEWWRCSFEPCADGLYLIWRSSGGRL
jgi:hypothetical protein